ncbi:hypothetical protein T4B_801 [Trichinella pseudospiralis]|uniref:Uncharacterized protein n=1 Tax=Trichinella pseudospiralis TaxID=6337 RepID=A0A0V1IU68_TRIPS|nr:hypothetical protein T4B_801 [Trichinella pseudospiralis]KRZ26335.1 hypothetical protein T4C_3550 [Trichinella pseudospiralis]
MNNVAVSASWSNVEAFKFASVGLIYDFAWWRKFVVVLAPFRCNNCCHRSTLDLGYLCSIIRTKAYEKAAKCSEEKAFSGLSGTPMVRLLPTAWRCVNNKQVGREKKKER